MSASVTLSKLSDRAKEAEESLEASKAKGQAALRTQVDDARTTVQQTAADMKQDRLATHSRAESRWTGIQEAWDDHVAKVHQDFEDRKADDSANRAEHRADRSEADAAQAISFAFAAIEDAEYALLEAALARMEAEEASVVAR